MTNSSIGEIKHHMAMVTPHPVFATTSTETIDFSIGFGFAALIYVSLETFREFYIDFIDIHHKIRVFMCFGLPHHVKCHQNITNSMLYTPNQLEIHTKHLWTFLMKDLILLPMQEMNMLMELMKEALSMCHSMPLL
jgi:hypothetical protein